MPAQHISPGSPASLRTANQQRVLGALRGGAPEGHSGAITQADLARFTGLAPATVSNIVRELTRTGVLETTPGSGRRGTSVRLSGTAGLVAGIDFGHSHVAVALGDVTGDIRGHRRAPLPADHLMADGLDLAARLLNDLLDEHGRHLREIRNIGLGLPVPIASGVVRSSAILPGWIGVAPKQVAEERWGCPVHVDNDANLGALAEHRLGRGRNYQDIVFIKVSSGIGAGIVSRGELFHGHAGTAGEVGHLTIDDQGPVCRCGSRGCLEAYVSSTTMQAMLAEQLPGATLDEIIQAANEGNVSARRTIEDTGLHLGWGVACLANLLNPELVILGGEMARAGDLLLTPVRTALRRHALDTVANTPVRISELGTFAALRGAVLIAADRTELVAFRDSLSFTR